MFKCLKLQLFFWEGSNKKRKTRLNPPSHFLLLPHFHISLLFLPFPWHVRSSWLLQFMNILCSFVFLIMIQSTASRLLFWGEAQELYISSGYYPPLFAHLNQLYWLSLYFTRPLYPISFDQNFNSEQFSKPEKGGRAGIVTSFVQRVLWKIAETQVHSHASSHWPQKWVKEGGISTRSIYEIKLF